MKISIAVPSYNYQGFLEVCLESIRTQDHLDYEVLIADGGSTDGSIETINRFCAMDSRFKLVSRKDSGQPEAVTKAFGVATGDIFCFLNADDHYLCRDALSSVVSAFSSYPGVDVISFARYYTDSDGRYVKPVHYRYHPADSMALMRYRTAVLQPATFWSRAVHDAIKLRSDFHYSFDSVFFYEAYCRFAWLELPKPVAGYRLHGSNKSVQIIPDRIFEIARFEQVKFGAKSLRSGYVRLIGAVVAILAPVPVIGKFLCRVVYRTVNTVSFLTVYRMPGI
jgi:glycosyltransferase involved in cell wall biosynthesis